MAEDAAERLARMRRVMVRLRRQGRVEEFEAVAAAYSALKRQQMERAEEEGRAAVRARRAQQRAEEPVRSGAWRLPYGFSSPLARERARSGWRAREEPVVPAGGLRPWRSRSLAQTRIWRP
ncbi:hypothetical protein QF032_003785 [Streptomyces achromogenes]|uniref:hypothetical protein n=1 Tax=Streptomyces achromogenes TaxID=67255 RepID=UPI002787BFF0|nr:hypothetical protein [Streptomyces achromogenes]MDQ0831941.1 hypothetical protein [Streptomyces achromogenes]